MLNLYCVFYLFLLLQLWLRGVVESRFVIEQVLETLGHKL